LRQRAMASRSSSMRSSMRTISSPDAWSSMAQG
jgi:hypothetical protein